MFAPCSLWHLHPDEYCSVMELVAHTSRRCLQLYALLQFFCAYSCHAARGTLRMLLYEGLHTLQLQHKCCIVSCCMRPCMVCLLLPECLFCNIECSSFQRAALIAAATDLPQLSVQALHSLSLLSVSFNNIFNMLLFGLVHWLKLPHAWHRCPLLLPRRPLKKLVNAFLDLQRWAG